MPNKTADIETAIELALADGPLTLDALMEQLGYIGDPRWVMVALVHLRQRGQVRYTTCDADHSHDGLCTVELVR